MSSNQSTEYMLTTVDNPFNPFTQFDEWNAYDIAMGYNSMSFLARLAVVSSDLPESDALATIDQAIDEIVAENVSGMWRKVSRDSFNDTPT